MILNVLKRTISSFILTIISFFIIIKGGLLFNLFLLIVFSIALSEWKKMTLEKNFFLSGVLFLILSFYTVFKIRTDTDEYGLSIFFFTLLICISTDVGGYVFGNIFKGPKLTKISPNKTYSGSIGAFILSLLTTYFYIDNSHLFFDISIKFDFIFLLTTFFISFISQIGDILISFFKRISNVKDTGNLIPGHGGILDRIDGIIFAYPIFYILQNFINFL